MSKGHTILRSKSIGAAHNEKARSAKYEIVTVLARREDYAELKKKGDSIGNQIAVAMRHYLKRMEGVNATSGTPGLRQDMGLVTTFQCGIPKNLCGEMRNLGGRFDFHTIDAIHLFVHGSESN